MTSSYFPGGDGDPRVWVVRAGFVTPGADLGWGVTKLLASRLHARMVAVDRWLVTGNLLTHMRWRSVWQCWGGVCRTPPPHLGC